MGALGGILGVLERSWEHLGWNLGHLGKVLEPLGSVLGPIACFCLLLLACACFGLLWLALAALAACAFRSIATQVRPYDLHGD